MTRRSEMNLTEPKGLFNRRLKNAGARFDEFLAKDGYVYAPGVHDPQHAQMVAQEYLRRQAAGTPCVFNGVYMSGWSIAAMQGGPWPDMGIHDRTDIVRNAWRIAPAASPLPLIADAETGFGPTVAMEVLVEFYHLAGVAVMHLEDQPTDRRCGHLGGKLVLGADAFTEKLVATLISLDGYGSDIKLLARTDAYSAANGSKEEALRRARQYADLEIGDALWEQARQVLEFDFPGKRRRVDLVWCELPTPDPREAEWFAREMKKYAPHVKLGFNASPNFKVDQWDGPMHAAVPARLQSYVDMGFDYIFHTIISAKSDMWAWGNLLAELAEQDFGAMIGLLKRLRGHPAGSGQTMSRAQEYQQFEQIVGGQAAKERYEKSHGFGSADRDSGSDIDATTQIVSGGTASTTALAESTETAQFEPQDKG